MRVSMVASPRPETWIDRSRNGAARDAHFPTERAASAGPAISRTRGTTGPAVNRSGSLLLELREILLRSLLALRTNALESGSHGTAARHGSATARGDPVRRILQAQITRTERQQHDERDQDPA